MRLHAFIAALCLAGCAAPGPESGSEDLALRALQYCEAQGGKHTLERGPGGRIAVCVFPDNRQCEEVALLRGQCARGGIPVGGYATTTERHCAIRGGVMTIPGCELSPAGTFETARPTSSGADERNVTLVLDPNHGAMLSIAFASRSRPSLVPGNWQTFGNRVTVSTEQERLVFDYTGDRLIPREWDRRMWGAAGPGTLMRQR